jgi:hypothetical protein
MVKSPGCNTDRHVDVSVVLPNDKFFWTISAAWRAYPLLQERFVTYMGAKMTISVFGIRGGPFVFLVSRPILRFFIDTNQ